MVLCGIAYLITKTQINLKCLNTKAEAPFKPAMEPNSEKFTLQWFSGPTR